ncbi:hypothetical protein GCM10027271_10950 [Saccharopolyspora gloriosae]
MPIRREFLDKKVNSTRNHDARSLTLRMQRRFRSLVRVTCSLCAITGTQHDPAEHPVRDRSERTVRPSGSDERTVHPGAEK